jgi:hypothetical protein
VISILQLVEVSVSDLEELGIVDHVDGFTPKEITWTEGLDSENTVKMCPKDYEKVIEGIITGIEVVTPSFENTYSLFEGNDLTLWLQHFQ